MHHKTTQHPQVAEVARESRKALRTLALGALALALAAGSASAQSLYWDLNGATAGSGGPTPSGTWDCV